jgi:hypothetical protein
VCFNSTKLAGFFFVDNLPTPLLSSKPMHHFLSLIITIYIPQAQFRGLKYFIFSAKCVTDAWFALPFRPGGAMLLPTSLCHAQRLLLLGIRVTISQSFCVLECVTMSGNILPSPPCRLFLPAGVGNGC